MTRDDLLAALQINNVGAWLRVIREGESNQNEDAYRIRFGGVGKPAAHFDSLEDHPRIFEPTEDGRKSSASGAFQITATTWDDYCSHVGKQTFAPENQSLCAVWLTNRAGALDDVIAGRLDAAIRKCSATWTSLGLAHRREKAPEIFQAYGGTLEAAPETIEETPTETPEVKPMGASILFTILSQLAEGLIPQLSALFGSGSAVQQRNVAAASILADTIVKATGAVNLQEAADKIQNDPQALQAARAAVADVWPSVVESGGGGLDGARKAAAVPDGDWRKAFLNPAFIIGLVMLALVCFVVVVIVYGLGSQTWSDEIKAMVVTAVVSGALGSVSGFFLGSSLGSQKKDAGLVAAANR